MKDNIFRAYDIRGKYPTDINEDVAYKIGLGYGSYIQEKYKQKACVVSHDNRLSSDSLYENLIKGLLETGINVISYNLTTTPMNYYARYLNHLFGIMVTASHNPKDENGFKFSFDHYANARGDMIQDFKNYINAGNFKKGKGIRIEDDITKDYIKYIHNNINLIGRKLKVVFDPANSVVTTILDKVLKNLNIDYIIINNESDGSFPSHHPDPSIESNLEQLKSSVLKEHADFGVGFDGDGDRIGIIDNEGYFLPIEKYAILIVRDIIDKYKDKEFLYDAKSSDIFKDEVQRLGGKSVICRTGSSYTQEMMLKNDLPFGFQYVGHICFNDRLFGTESAIYNALRFVELLMKSNESLHEQASKIKEYYTTDEEKIASSDNIKHEVIEKIKLYCDNKKYKYIEIDGLKILFDSAWAYVRASNTGPNITLRCEAKDKQFLNKIHDEIFNLVKEYNIVKKP